MLLKYKGTYWNLFYFLLKNSLTKRYTKEEAQILMKDTKVIYKNMLEETDDIGDNNPMASNIYASYVFIALWKASKGKISIEELRSITQELMNLGILKTVAGCVDVNKPSHMKKLENKLKNSAKWVDENPKYKDITWDFNFDSKKHEQGFYYHFTKCPIEKYCREHDLLEVLPVMCDIDFLSAKLVHATLYREQTLAKGGDKCDYWFVGDKSEIQN